MIHQLKCPDLVNIIPAICYLDVKLQGKFEEVSLALKTVDGFTVSKM
jgi:hypothetical protein